jgi:hypothetical protein
LLYDGTNYEAIKTGELVLGQYETLSRGIRAATGLTTTYAQPQSRTVMPSGQVIATRLSEDKSRIKTFEHIATSVSEQTEIHALYERCNHGADPIVFVPMDDDAGVLFGHMEKPALVETRRAALTDYYIYEIGVIESPFALSVG